MGTFYRTSTIDKDGYFDQTYTELSDGQNEKLFVSGGPTRDRMGFWNIQLAQKPSFGAAQLVGARLHLYCNAIERITDTFADGTGLGTEEGYALKLFKTKERIANISEGDTRPSTQDILCYSAFMEDVNSLWFDALDGSNFYSSPEINIERSISDDYKVAAVGAYITLKELYDNQRGVLGSGYSIAQLYFRYYLKPKISVLEGAIPKTILGGVDLLTFGHSQEILQWTIPDTYALTDPFGSTGVHATYTTPTEIETYASTIKISMVKMTGYQQAATMDGLVDATHRKLSQASNYTKSAYKSLKKWAWGDDAEVKYPPTTNYQIPERWQPVEGRGTFSDDVYVNADDVFIRHATTETIVSVASTVPGYGELAHPPPDSIISEGMTVFQNIRTANFHEYVLKDGDVEGTDDTEGDVTGRNRSGMAVPIAMSNFVYVDDEGSKSAMMENLHGFYPRDGTPSGKIRASNGKDFLQEVRGQIFVPAPLNIDGSDENDQYPYLSFEGKLELPGGPFALNTSETASAAGKVTLRRALWLTFNRYPIGRQTDMLKAVHEAAPGRTAEGMNGFVIFEANGIPNGQDYYAVAWIGDLDFSLSFDPQFNYGTDLTDLDNCPQAYIRKDLIESTYLTFKFWFTVDGVKFTVMDGSKSALLDVTQATGIVKLPEDDNGPLPYISMSGLVRDDATTHYDNIGEWSSARKYHIKSGTSGTGNNEPASMGGFAPVASTETTKTNFWAADITPQTFHTEDSEGTAKVTAPDGDAQRGIDGIASAGLQMMWLPYFTMSLTSTRTNGHYAHNDDTYIKERLIANMQDLSSTDGQTRSIDSHARFWIDNIGAYRFNYGYQNSTITTGNTIKGKMTIPQGNKFGTIRLAADGKTSMTEDTAEKAYHGKAFVEKTNYAYLTFGFKTKSECEGGAKFFLMNGFFTDPDVPYTNPASNENKFGMIYSDDSHPFGENHSMGNVNIPKEYYLQGEPASSPDIRPYANKGRGTTNSIDQASPFKQSEGSGNSQAFMKYNVFGSTIHHRGRALVEGNPAHNYDGIIGHETDSGIVTGFPNLNSLSPTADYDMSGAIRVENFSQAGIWSTDFNASAFAEIAHVEPVGQCCGTDVNLYTYGRNNVNNTSYKVDTPYVYHSFAAHEVGTASDTISDWYATFGVREKMKGGTNMPNWIGPNLNWGIRFEPSTSTVYNNAVPVADGNAGYEVYQDRMATIPAVAGNYIYFTNTNSSGDGLQGSTFNQHISTNTDIALFPGLMVRRENPFTHARIIDCRKIDANVWDIMVDETSVLTLGEEEKFLVYHGSREWVPTFEAIHHSDTYHASNTGDVNKRQDGHLTVNEPRNTDSNVVGKELHDMIRQNKFCATIVTITQQGEGTFRCTGVDTDGATSVTGNTNSANHFTGDVSADDPNSTLDDIMWADTAKMGPLHQDGSSTESIGFSTAKIPQGRFLNADLCISPWRYWLTVRVPLQGYTRAYTSMLGVTSVLDPDFSEPAGAGCAIRSTYNESEYTDSHRYTNYWAWDPIPDTPIELSTDFGYGPLDDEGKGGYVALRPMLAGQYNEIAFDGVAVVGSLKERAISTLVGFANEDENILFEFASGESTNPPYLVTVFVDQRPTPPTSFTVEPDEETPFYPRFSWTVEDDDLWYGFLIIDDQSIHNQYHGAIFHAPFNWVGTGSSDGPKYYKPNLGLQYQGTDPATGLETQSGFLTERGGVKHAVDGLQGFTVDFDGTNDYLELPNTSLYPTADADHPTETMSISLHIVPRNSPTTDEYLMYKEYEYGIWLDSDQQINVHIYPDDAGDNAKTAKHIPLELKSTSIVTCNDEVPTSIIVNVDTGLKSGNVKLYINGKLEDQTGLRRDIASKNNWPTDKNMEVHGEKAFFGCKYPAGISTRSVIIGDSGSATTTKIYVADTEVVEGLTVPIENPMEGFDSYGTIKIGSEEITYTSIGARSFLGCTRGANGTSAAVIGAAATISRLANKFYDGKMEEIVIFNRLIHPITPKDEYFTYTQPKAELTSAAEAVSKSYVGKLFLKDYHNIRGVSDSEVTSTPQISFRKAAFRLRTN